MAGPVLSANNHPPALDSQCRHAHPPTFLKNNPSSSLAYPSSHPHQYYQHAHQLAPQPSSHSHPLPPPPSLPHHSHHPTHPSPQPPLQSGSHYHHYPSTPLKPTLPGIASILAFAGQAHSFVHPSSPVTSNRTQSSDPLAHAHPIGPVTVDHSSYHASHRSSICHAGLTPGPPLNQRRRRSSSMTIVPADQRSTHCHSVDPHQRSPHGLTADLSIASPPLIDAPHSIFSLSRSPPDQTNSDSFGDDRAAYLCPLPPARIDEPLQRRHSERLPPRRALVPPKSYPSPSLQSVSLSSSYDHPAPSSSSALPHSSYHALAHHPSWPSTNSTSPSLLQDSNHNSQHCSSSTSHQRRLSSTSSSSSNESSQNPMTRPIIITSPVLLATGPSNNRYQCPEHGCGKTFSRPSSLKIHTYSHTGQKPFKCLRCDRAFSVQSNLKRHQKVHERRNGKICGSGSGNGRGKETSPMATTGGGAMGSAEEGDDESDMMEED